MQPSKLSYDDKSEKKIFTLMSAGLNKDSKRENVSKHAMYISVRNRDSLAML